VAVGPPAALGRVPRLRLAVLPTPLQPAPRLSEALGVEVWVKRDDLTGVGLGGNKARKVEFLLGEATAGGADVILTGGGPGSNHVQITAAATATVGLDCVAVLYGCPPEPEPANLRLARLLGAEVRFTADTDRASVDAGLEAVAARLRSEGRRPYVIGRGGATPVGSLGYVEATFELGVQLAEAGVTPDQVVLATGSCGTQAGLCLGAALAGARYEVLGVTVSRPPAECVERISRLAGAAAALLDQPAAAATMPPPHVVDGIGPGYGRASAEGIEAAELAARGAGLLLDPVFTAKAMAQLIAEARAGRLRAGPVVFLHTGGAGGLMGGGAP